METPWPLRDASLSENVRWAAIGLAGLFGAHGLITLAIWPPIEWAPTAIGAALAATFLVRELSRKLYIVFFLFYIAGWFGLTYAAVAYFAADEFPLEIGFPAAGVFVLYLLVGFHFKRASDRARAREVMNESA